jgi:hypothetical protein
MASAWERRNWPQRRAGPARGRVESCLLQRFPHGRRSDADAKAGQLTLNPAVAPARILAGQAKHQAADIAVDRRAPGLPVAGPCRPAAANDVAMPAQYRIRGHRHPQAGSPGARDHAEQRRDQRPVRPRGLRPGPGLPPQDRELVTQQQYLRVLPGFLPPEQPRPRDQPSHQQADEPQAHDR